jgi:hypothetical protein
MFIILEWNGVLPAGYMGEVLKTDGSVRMWKSGLSAKKWARKNCAFEWEVVEL